MISKTISHYKILEKLGSGGMGVVYKAEDTKLKRTVALKFLPPELTRDEDAKGRFIHEAQAASSLEHNNICNIHEIDETEDGQIFIVMACYEGQALKERIEHRPLKLTEALDIATQIAEGLAKAHEKDIVHRDIKPANIMMTTDGVVKIVDFGLAKLAGRTKLTKSGTTMGTVAYMSPEQTRGEDVDERADIWSLGVVFYEMVTGQQPFKGEYEQAVMYSIMHEEPEPMTGLRTNVSIELERIANKCLKKESSQRYQHIDELVVDLRQVKKETESQKISSATGVRKPAYKTKFLAALSGVIVMGAILALIGYFIFSSNTSDLTSKRKIVAVLPFKNLGEAEDEYFADGITDEITARLAGISGLGVIARESAFKYKGLEIDIQEIGKKLGVQYILSGTIRWQRAPDGDSRVKVTPKLINVADNTNVWANIYDKVMSDIFEVQSEIAENVTKALNVAVLEPERRALKAKPTENLEAYNFYLRGIEANFDFRMKAALSFAEQMLQKAVELDSSFAHAHAWLGVVHSNFYFYGQDRSKERLAKSREAIDKALKLNPQLPDAYNALGLNLYRYTRDYERAIEEFETALEFRPDDARAIRLIADVKKRQAKFEQAIEYYNQAAVLNPSSVNLQNNIGLAYLLSRRYAEAEQTFERMILLWPDYSLSYYNLARTYLIWEGDKEKAIEIYEMALKNLDSRFEKDILCRIATTKGEYNDALQHLVLAGSIFYYLEKASLYDFLGNDSQKFLVADSAKSVLEARIRSEPDTEANAFYHYRLGVAYAFLGLKEEAIRTVLKADELWPISKEPVRGIWWREALPKIYVLVGDYDSAIDQIEYLLSIPSYMTVAKLRTEPDWAPLRDHPRFQKLINEGGYSEK